MAYSYDWIVCVKSKMKKIALCLHGLFNSNYDRSSKGLDGYEYIKEKILQKGDVDVFVHCWEKEMVDTITQLYNPKKLMCESRVRNRAPR